MFPAELIEIIKKLDPDKSILCQVVGTEDGAWNMDYKFTSASEIEAKFKSPMCFNLLTVSHRQLKNLPSVIMLDGLMS